MLIWRKFSQFLCSGATPLYNKNARPSAKFAVINLQTFDRHQSLTVTSPSTGVSLQGTLQIPGDKSISHRALMLGALAEGETTIQGLLLGEDPRSTAACFTAMGAQISELNTELVTVTGIGLGQLQEPVGVIDEGNSGTTMRLMLDFGFSSRSILYCNW